jgi:hypothetical protein
MTAAPRPLTNLQMPKRAAPQKHSDRIECPDCLKIAAAEMFNAQSSAGFTEPPNDLS